MYVSWVCCALCRQWFLRRADRSIIGVLPGVCVCLSVCDGRTFLGIAVRCVGSGFYDGQIGRS
jgi:hypothetical protein